MITVIARRPLTYRGQDVLIGQSFEMSAVDAMMAHHKGEIAWTTEKAIVNASPIPLQKDSPTTETPPAAPAADQAEDESTNDDSELSEAVPTDEAPPTSSGVDAVETPRRRGRSRYRRGETDVERTTDIIAEQ